MVDLKEKLIEEIKKSGFPLEVYTSVILNKANWFVKTNVNYFNKLVHDGREIDIVAERKTKGIERCIDTLIIECKKSSAKSWVFFKQQKSVDVQVMNIVSPRADNYHYKWFEEKHFNDHFYTRSSVATYYMVGGVKNPQETRKDSESGPEQVIHKAVTQVMDALVFYWNRDTDVYVKEKISKMNFLYPIIVYDGLLFSAKIDGDNIDLTPENHISLYVEWELAEPMKVYYSSKGQNLRDIHQSKPFIIDVVKKEYLEEFLKNLD